MATPDCSTARSAPCARACVRTYRTQVSVWDIIRMLAISWTGNYIGCVGMAGLMAGSMVFHDSTTTLRHTCDFKTSHTWGTTFIKGILANWLVGIAT